MVHDLVQEYSLADVHTEIALIDVGTIDARRHLAAGWHQDEIGADGLSFAWSQGDESAIEFFLLRPRPMTVEFRCRPFEGADMEPQVVSPAVNGVPMPDVELTSGFATYRLTLPLVSVRSGRNRLVFKFRRAVSPREIGRGNDWRRLAVAMDWIRLEPGSNPPQPSTTGDGSGLTLSSGSRMSVFGRFTPDLQFELDGVVRIGGDGGRLLCAVTVESGQRTVLVDVSAGTGALRVDVSGPTGEPFRLDLEVPRQGESLESGPTLKLAGPRLTAIRGEERQKTRGSEAEEFSEPERPNVVIYLVDALRADRLGIYGQPRPLSPNVDAFAARATVYEQAWAQSSWTRPAVASIFTGLRPEVHGTNGRLDRLGVDMPTLAERFAMAGYATAAVVANPNVSADFGFDRGFDSYVLMDPENRRSSDLQAEVSAWLDARDRDRPFLLYVHTVDPHLPYEPPARYRKRFAPSVVRDDLGATEVVGALQARSLVDEVGFVGDLVALYDAEVACNDDTFAMMLGELETRGLASDTVVVFLSDHGEEFYDHGGWIHGRTLYREVMQVPLVIRYAGQQEGSRFGIAVQHVDLMPTLLDAAGLEPVSGLHGNSLLRDLPADRLISGFLDVDQWGGRSVVSGRWKTVVHRDMGFTGPVSVFDHVSDPGEYRDVSSEHGILGGALVSESGREVLAQEGRFAGGEAVIDEELRRRLEALGYL